MTLSLRTRVTLLAALIVLITLGAVGVVTLGVTEVEVSRFLVRQSLDDQEARLAQVQEKVRDAPSLMDKAKFLQEEAQVLQDQVGRSAEHIAELAAQGMPAVAIQGGKAIASADPALLGGAVRELPGGLLEIEGDGVKVVLQGEGLAALAADHSKVLLLPTLPSPQVAGPKLVAPIRRGVVVALLIAAACGILLAWALARRLTGPLEELTRAVRRMEEGDLSVRVAASSHDEVGSLATAFNGLATRLERVEKVRRAMVSDIAHELRAPLTAMRCDLEAVQDGLRPFDGTQVELLHRGTLALAGLVEDLQELALAEAGQLRLEKEDCNLEALCRDLLDALAAQTAARHIELELDAEGEPVEVEVDPRRLAQALRNLLANALAHAPDSSAVLVCLRHGVDGVGSTSIEVIDHGPGIPGAEQERVFDRFYRLDPSRSRSSGGSGLGLAIAKALIEAHEGRLSVATTAGGGATFRVELPSRH